MADSANGFQSASGIDPNSTIGDMLDLQVERYPDRDALVNVEAGERYTYAEFRDEVDRVARGLMALGIDRGQHVGIWATNYSEWVLTQFATAKIGAVMVNVNPAYRTHEIAYLLEQSEANALILIGRFRNSDYAGMLNEVVPELKDSNPGELNSHRFPYLRNVIHIVPHDDRDATTPDGMWSWQEMVARHIDVSVDQLADRQSGCRPNDPVNIQYTSGTTGNPKGAMLTHHNLVSNGLYVGDAIELTEEDRLCVPVPFYHCFGCVMGNLGCITHGSAIVIATEHFDPLKTLQAIGTGAMHRPLRRADYVHRAAGPPRVRQLRRLVPSHRHHGRVAVPHRGDAAGHRPDGRASDDHRLRSDRAFAGHHADAGVGLHRAPGVHRGRGAAGSGGAHR